MDTKVKYQYTYFIYSYYLEKIEFNEYIIKILNNKKYKLKIFEKEKDLDIYNYFDSNIKKEFFNTFYINKNGYDIKNIYNNKCVIFEYFLEKNIQGKLKNNNNIFFEIPKIELICFNTGVCFLVFKTYLEKENINFVDVLNFNYKIKDIHSEFSKLKSYENIIVQTDSLTDIRDFGKFIEDIIMQKPQNKSFFTYAYTCVESENWNNEIDRLENDFLKYAYVYPQNYDLTFEEGQEIIRLNNWKYLKVAFTNKSMVFLGNNLENSNFTKIPYKFENEYYYSLILNLYKKELLENIEKNNIKIKTIEGYECLYEELLNNNLTEDEIGEKINNKLKMAFKLNDKLNKIKIKLKNKIEVKLIKKYKLFGKIILLILIISLIINLLFLLT